MNVKSLALTALLLSATTAFANAASLGAAAAAVVMSSSATSSNSDSYTFPGSTSQDIMRNFQLGNYSYELVRVSQYDLEHVCLGHKARHAEMVMDNIERVCGAVSYPARKPAGMLLRESNYFDCGRDQLRVDLIDKSDLGQQCALGFVNANGEEWVNGAKANGRVRRGILGVAVAVGGLSMLR
jgi:hypothetical protein